MPQWNLLDNSKNLVNLYIFSDVVQTKWLFCVIKDILIKDILVKKLLRQKSC